MNFDPNSSLVRSDSSTTAWMGTRLVSPCSAARRAALARLRQPRRALIRWKRELTDDALAPSSHAISLVLAPRRASASSCRSRDFRSGPPEQCIVSLVTEPVEQLGREGACKDPDDVACRVFKVAGVAGAKAQDAEPLQTAAARRRHDKRRHETVLPGSIDRPALPSARGRQPACRDGRVVLAGVEEPRMFLRRAGFLGDVPEPRIAGEQDRQGPARLAVGNGVDEDAGVGAHDHRSNLHYLQDTCHVRRAVDGVDGFNHLCRVGGAAGDLFQPIRPERVSHRHLGTP